MKQVLLVALLLCTMNGKATSKNNVGALSSDPRSPLFVMYLNDKLSVEGISIEGSSMKQMFGKDYKHVDHTDDSVYWVLSSQYYKIWWPEYQMMFTVKPITGNVSLGSHFIMFLNTIRSQRKNVIYQKQEASCKGITNN